MVAFGDFWAINPPKVEVTVTVKVEVKGVLKDEVKRVLRAPEAACVVNLFEDSGKASVWGSQQLVTRFKGTAVPESGHQEKPDRRLSGVEYPVPSPTWARFRRSLPWPWHRNSV